MFIMYIHTCTYSAWHRSPLLYVLTDVTCTHSVLLIFIAIIDGLAFPIPSHEPTVTPDPRQALGALAFQNNHGEPWNSSIQRVVFENAFRWGRNLRIYKQAGKLCNTTNHVNLIRKDPTTCSSCPVWKLSPGRQSLYPHFRANSNPCHRRAARPRVEAAIWAVTKRTWGKALGSDGLIKRLNRLKVRYSVLTAAVMFQATIIRLVTSGMTWTMRIDRIE